MATKILKFLVTAKLTGDADAVSRGASLATGMLKRASDYGALEIEDVKVDLTVRPISTIAVISTRRKQRPQRGGRS